jgi:Amidohydrolase
MTMHRRELMLDGAIGASCLAAVWAMSPAFSQNQALTPRQEAITAWKRRLRNLLDRGRLPIIDLQATYVEGLTDVTRMMEHMNALDIAQIAFAPANAPTGAPSLELHRKHPEFFIPTTNSGEFQRWWRDPLAFLSVARKDLESGLYVFMGEHEFRHYPSPEQVRARRTDRDITVDISGPAGHALFALSAEFGVAFQIHYEIEDALLPALESMLTQYPKATVIWCHLAMIRYPDRSKRYNAVYVAGLIERFPGLHFDLAVPPPNAVYAPSGALHSTLFSKGQLDEAWKALIEKHPDRFLASSDYRPPVADEYPSQIIRQRELILNVLSEPARHRVAYANAWRLVTGSPWSN